jgi:hypothetical protein
VAAKSIALYVKLAPVIVILDEYVYIDVVDKLPILSPPPKTASSGVEDVVGVDDVVVVGVIGTATSIV